MLDSNPSAQTFNHLSIYNIFCTDKFRLNVFVRYHRATAVTYLHIHYYSTILHSDVIFSSSNRAITEQRETEKAIREEVELATRRIDEINAELETVVCQLGEAKVERHESSRAAKKQELIENLKRLFPGVVSSTIY